MIAFEGMDGCGKSTQARRFAEVIQARKGQAACLLVREPGATPTAEAVRRILLESEAAAITPEAELFLYLAARADLYGRIILPALARGTTVVSDRCFWSTVAYQGAGLDLGVEQTRALSLVATQQREPDLVLVFDVPPDVAQKRLTGDADRIEGRDPAYRAKVRQAFLDLAEAAGPRAAVIDASASIDAIHQQVLIQTSQFL